MRELSTIREVHRRMTREAFGIAHIGNRIVPIQLRAATQIGNLLELPDDIDGQTSLQDSNGDDLFMVDISTIDGGHTLA